MEGQDANKMHELWQYLANIMTASQYQYFMVSRLFQNDMKSHYKHPDVFSFGYISATTDLISKIQKCSMDLYADIVACYWACDKISDIFSVSKTNIPAIVCNLSFIKCMVREIYRISVAMWLRCLCIPSLTFIPTLCYTEMPSAFNSTWWK